MPDLPIFPETIAAWVTLVTVAVFVVSVTYRLLTLPTQLERLELLSERHTTNIERIQSDQVSHSKELDNQAQASLAIAEFLVERHGVAAAKAFIALVPPETDDVVIHQFGSHDVYTIPRTAVTDSVDRAPKAEAEEDETERVIRHEVELAEWDLEFTQALLDRKSGDAIARGAVDTKPNP